MRSVLLAFAVALIAAPALAQETEMDRAERDLRQTMAPAATAGAVVERVSPDEVRVRMPSDITFDFNRADVRWEFMPLIQDLATTLRRYPGMSIEIVGHADAIGSDEYNQALSERRAQSVGAALMNSGVAFQRIGTRGMGEWEPIASNASAWGRARNRRVEIAIKTVK
jgi:outer membrane protein OmpA-like peptidoglycan-associated protein